MNFIETKASNNNEPSILIIEGLWGAGKSTLISRIRARYPVLFVPEPNFQTSGIKKEISEWYKNQHNQRLKEALNYSKNGEHVVMERSILSSAAFYYAKFGTMPDWFKQHKSSLLSISNLHIVFLFTDKRTFKNNARYIKDRSVRMAIGKYKSFYENYLDFFKKIGIEVRFIESKNLLNSKLRITDFQDVFHSKNRSEFKEVIHHCSSAVIMYKGKLLILYSQKHNQFTLPQGHQEDGENPKQAILREIAEEAGYIDLSLVGRVRNYSFRFYNGDFVTKKTTDCYLLKLKSLRSTKKRMEKHESYKNLFVGHEKGLRMLNWPEDRDNVVCALKLVHKKSRPSKRRDQY